MVIRVKPEVGQLIVISKSWFESNAFFSQFMENIQPGKVYQIKKIEVLDDEWGISSIQDVETLEIFDVVDHPELDDYWCIFDKYDSIRVIET